jgi:hypothetical protein
MRKAAVLSLLLLAGTAVAALPGPITAGDVHVKRALADTMTADQLQAHKEKMAAWVNERSAQRAGRVRPLTPADNCGAATYEISALPFGPIADTTVGATDDYDLPNATTDPTCTASSICTGTGLPASLPRGSIYTGTGTGPDRAFKIKTDANCTLTISMTPTGGQDLALIVYQSTCSSLLSDCVCVSDKGQASQTETVTLSAVAGTNYFIVVDGYLSSSGPFTVSIAGQGCSLTPVKLQDFDAN